MQKTVILIIGYMENLELNGMERNGIKNIRWNINNMEWNRMEWNEFIKK